MLLTAFMLGVDMTLPTLKIVILSCLAALSVQVRSTEDVEILVEPEVHTQLLQKYENCRRSALSAYLYLVEACRSAGGTTELECAKQSTAILNKENETRERICAPLRPKIGVS